MDRLPITLSEDESHKQGKKTASAALKASKAITLASGDEPSAKPKRSRKKAQQAVTVAEVEAVSPIQQLYAQINSAEAQRIQAEREAKPLKQFYDPHNASVLKADLFARPVPATYARTAKTLPAGINRNGDTLDGASVLTEKAAFEDKAAQIRAQQDSKYGDMDAFGANTTNACKLYPDGTRSMVTLANSSRSKGHVLAGKLTGDSAVTPLSLTGVQQRIADNYKSDKTKPVPALDIPDWQKIMNTAPLDRIRKANAEKERAARIAAGLPEQEEGGVFQSFRKLVSASVKRITKPKEGFADTVMAENVASTGRGK